MNEELIQRVKQCPKLPSLPAIAVQVLELAQNVDVDISEIARTISRDSALSGKILRTVNSSFYGRGQAVSTVSHALVILGLQSVKTLVLGFSLVSNLTRTKPSGFKHVVYWKRSIYAATAARTLAAKINLVQQEEAFLSALLMDIGMLVLDTVLGEEYGAIVAKVPFHNDLPDVERDALKMTHAEVGGAVAEHWKLPPVLTVPVANHHSPAEVDDATLRQLAEIVQLSGRCADVFVDDAPASAIADVRALCAQYHQFSEADTDALLADIGNRTKEVATLFEINIGSSKEYEAILKRAHHALAKTTIRNEPKPPASATAPGPATAGEPVPRDAKSPAPANGEALAGLADRARFDQFIAEAFAAAQQKQQPMALLMFNIDQ